MELHYRGSSRCFTLNGMKPFNNTPCSLSPALLKESMLLEWYSPSQEIMLFLDRGGGKR
jgi:hypothetical protein